MTDADKSDRAGRPDKKEVASDCGLRLVENAEGVFLPIRVQPGAAREQIVGRHGTALKVAVHAPPEKGRANEAVIAVLAAALQLPVSRVSLAGGPASRDKRLFVLGLSAAELTSRLAPFL